MIFSYETTAPSPSALFHLPDESRGAGEECEASPESMCILTCKALRYANPRIFGLRVETPQAFL